MGWGWGEGPILILVDFVLVGEGFLTPAEGEFGAIITCRES